MRTLDLPVAIRIIRWANELPKDQHKVLRALAKQNEFFDPCFFSFKTLAKRARLNRVAIRRACRRLDRKGLAQYANGLWSDEGMAGAGYAITIEGKAVLRLMEESLRKKSLQKRKKTVTN